MGAVVAVMFKVMPVSPSVNLDELKKNVEAILQKIGGTIHNSEEQPIAFGLKALVFTIGWPEEKNPDIIENEIAKIKDVNSIEITDVRRAFG